MKRILGAPHVRIRIGPFVLAVALCAVAAAVSNKTFNWSPASLVPGFVLAQLKSGLEHDGREVYDRRIQIVDAVGLAPGMTVADIGAGTGLFARLFAQRVGPAGRVYATDISRWAVFKATVLARAEHLGNLTAVVNGEADTGLAPESLDVAFLCDVYHHFAKPWTMLHSIYRSLKPGGRLVLVDYDRVPGKSPAWILEHVSPRYDKATVISDFEDAGFRLRDEETFLSENYLLVFQRP
jgi:predicted methyltransferase